MLKRFDTFTNGPAWNNLPSTLLSNGANNPQMKQLITERRISLLRGFAEYMNRIGYSYIPKGIVTIDRCVYQPYIFQTKRWRIPASAIVITIWGHHTAIKLFLWSRVLYGCGLRVSEAVKLKGRCRFKNGTLFVKHTKFNKQRIIPIADSLLQH